jgi:hypothetical protein
MNWDKIKNNIQTLAKDSLGLYGWMQHKPWFDEQCSKIFISKQAKMQWSRTQLKSR